MKIIIGLMLLFISAFANIGKISAVVGDANVKRGSDSITAKVGVVLEEKDIIYTQKNAKVQIVFNDKTVVTIGKNSALDINEYVYDTNNPKNSKTDLNFFKGAFKTISGNIGKINREKFKLRTKNATIGIRGTIILGNEEIISCLRNEIIIISNRTGESVFVPQGHFVELFKKGTPVSRLEVKPFNEDALDKLDEGFKVEGEQLLKANPTNKIKRETIPSLFDNTIPIQDIVEQQSFEDNRDVLDVDIDEKVEEIQNQTPVENQDSIEQPSP